MSRITTYLQRSWKAERGLFNWLPVLFGAGIGLYFALPAEPPHWLLPMVAAIATLAFLRTKMPLALRLSLLLLAFGAAAAQVATIRAQPIILHEALTPRPITGLVDDIERTEHGVRLTLREVEVEDIPPEQTPLRIRLSVRLKVGSTLALPQIGDRVQMLAGLMPPMGPALPHSFDFARFFFFKRIGAVGFGLPPWEVVEPASDVGPGNQFRNWRVGLTERIIHQLGSPTGAVAAGLITGDARAIPETDFNALRAANLYHIIAISGEHMVVIAGVIFVSLRLLALLLPSRWRFRPQVKSIAAAVSLLLVTAYLFVTGLPTSAVRAYFMIALVLLAVMLHRQVDAVRSLAITALIMLFWNPADLLDPGFQLSFAATLAILTFVDTVLRSGVMDRRFAIRALAAVGSMLMISVVAELATAPIAIAHFNNFGTYGIFANMLATSLVSFYLMPTVALFFVLLPFGLQGFALTLMGHGIDWLLSLAHWVASFPQALHFVPSIPAYGLALFGIGLLWLCLMQGHWRRYGLVAAALGISTILLNPTPDMLIGPGGKQVALNTSDGYALARGKPNAMLAELWANGLGYHELPKAGEPDWRCDGLGCIARVDGKRIALPRSANALPEDCARAEVVAYTNATCDKARTIAGPIFTNQVSALWLHDGIHIEHSSDWQGNRPWSHAVAENEDE